MRKGWRQHSREENPGNPIDIASLRMRSTSSAPSLELFYEQHGEAVLKYCRFRIHNREDAEDTAAQIFIKRLARIHPMAGDR